jgi:hypothetical protein
MNIEISINNIKQQLVKGDIRSHHIYDVLDKFFMDVPDIVALNASWLSKDSVEHLIEKQKIHEEIKSSLGVLNELMCAGGTESVCDDVSGSELTAAALNLDEPEIAKDAHQPQSSSSSPTERSTEAGDTTNEETAPKTTQKKKKAKRGKK